MRLHDHSQVFRAPPADGHVLNAERRRPHHGHRERSPTGQAIPSEVAYGLGKEEADEIRRFLARERPPADRAIFGGDCDWSRRPVVIEARLGERLVGGAMGEVVAGMARLHDLLVVQSSRGRGVGGRLVDALCGRAATLGAARCYLRCPATEPHRRFYERLGFVQVARLPRYYHHHDFLEYLREPIVRA
jgi:GNAT superfamily N-acetyltransferase